MTNPVPADGQPIPEGMVAGVDETVAELQGGVTYVLAAVTFADAQAARQDIRVLTAGRTRSFHWHREGPSTREAAIERLEAHAVATRALAGRAGRQAQTGARAKLMFELVTDLTEAGVGHVIIESRGPREDGRDRSVILDNFRERATGAFTYDWRTKAEPLFGYPDALAGIAREHPTLGHAPGFSRLQKANIVTEVRYTT